MRPTLAVAYDRLLVAEGLRKLVAPEFDVLGLTPNGAPAGEWIAEHKPQVTLVEIGGPHSPGFASVETVRAHAPATRIVAVTADDLAGAGIEGVAATVSMNSNASELIRVAFETIDAKQPQNGTTLTERQRQVLEAVCGGLSLKQISELLSISPKTVEYHKYRLMGDLGCKTTADLIRFAFARGITA